MPSRLAVAVRGLLAASLLLATGGTAEAAQRAARGRMYELVVLDAHARTVAAAVDRGGRAAGLFSDAGQTTAFVWRRSTGETPLVPLAGSPWATAGRINRDGFVVGTSFSPATTRATLWSPAGTPLEIPIAGSTLSVPNAINDAGVVVGTARVASQWEHWIWDAVNGTRSLAALGLPSGGSALDVNEALEVCGGRSSGEAFVLDVASGVVTSLGSFGGDWGHAHALSDAGHVVGAAAHPLTGVQTPFVWTPDLGMRSLGTLSGPGLPVGRANAVNDRGTVVGSVEVTGSQWHAFLWEEDLGMRDLNDLVRRGQLELREAFDVSDTGWIAGEAVDSSSGFAVTVGFVLKPL